MGSELKGIGEKGGRLQNGRVFCQPTMCGATDHAVKHPQNTIGEPQGTW